MQIPKGYEDFKCSLTKCSLDSDHCKSLIDDESEIVNYDAVKNEYVRLNLKGCQCSPCSVDGLFIDSGKNYVFVEFKAGDVKIKELVQKIYDSALIFIDKDVVSTKWLREKACFVLVTNNHDPRRELAKLGSKHSSKPFRPYIPEHIEGFFYKRVMVMTSDEFKRTYCC